MTSTTVLQKRLQIMGLGCPFERNIVKVRGISRAKFDALEWHH